MNTINKPRNCKSLICLQCGRKWAIDGLPQFTVDNPDPDAPETYAAHQRLRYARYCVDKEVIGICREATCACGSNETIKVLWETIAV